MGPGRSVYERYGHNAIWIRDLDTGTDLVYNYGTFDFTTPGFVTNFIKGRPRYWLGVSDLGETLRQYTHAERDVVAQELNLSPAQRSELATYLAYNALPENRVYTYDYFLDNCSTRVRDALDRVLQGALRDGTVAQGRRGELSISHPAIAHQRRADVHRDHARAGPTHRPTDQSVGGDVPAGQAAGTGARIDRRST